MRDGFLSFVFRKAWPNQSLDRLLRAATLRDMADAATAWREFETTADFDHLTAGEMRLIGLAAKRVASLAPDSPMLARIGGIERANWSRSQLTIGAAGEGLRVLHAASIDMLAIKGAGRFASGDPAARGRMLNDVDIVVRSGGMTRAFDLLTRDGWQPAGSGTVLFHRSVLDKAVGINLVRGRFGNLDLHNSPFRPPYAPTADEAAIWSRASASKLGYVPVWVPSATDAVTIAIAHGALDAHKSSDWLADIAAGIDGGVDWELLEALVEDSHLHAPAAVALGYVRERLLRPVPAPLLARLGEAAARRPLGLLASLAETRPKAGSIGFFWIVRALAKQSRLLRSRPARSRSPIVLPSPAFDRPELGSGPLVLEQALPLPDRQQGQSWSGTVDFTILVKLPPASRRIDFEVNSQARHLARLRAVVINRGARERLLRFRLPIELAPDDDSPVLTAAASRSFNSDAPANMIDRYGAAPFRIVRFRSKRSRDGRKNHSLHE
jgi:hypothetical protein